MPTFVPKTGIRIGRDATTDPIAVLLQYNLKDAQKVPLSRGLYGKYLPKIQTALDLILLNAIFAIVVALNPDIEYHGKLRLIGVLLNVAFIPAAYYFHKIHSMRTLRMEKLVSGVFQGAVLMALLFTTLMVFLSIPGIPAHFYLELLAGLAVLYPMAWILEELLLRRYRRSGYNYIRAVIVGTGETAIRVARNLRSDSGYGIRILGYFGRQPNAEFTDPYIGTVDRLADYIKENGIQEIYYADSGENEEQLKNVINIADDRICKFYYIPPLSHYIKRNFYLVPINNSLPSLSLHPNPLQNPVNRIVKRAFDICFSTIVLLSTPILLPPIAIAIKISSPGPIFFRQTRTGYRGREFCCYKFRTMKINAEADTLQASRNDARKTRVGNFLRHTSIDELPQFWNVLKGDMSVVGPRPHMLAHTESYRQLIDQYMVRHLIKPGITGWAQIRGLRGATDELWMMEKRVDSDVWYIEHWSFMLDLKIIIRTITNAIPGGKNAY